MTIADKKVPPNPEQGTRPIVSVLIECDGRTYRVIDNIREFLGGEQNRYASEHLIGRKLLDVARPLDAGQSPKEPR